MAQVQRHTRLLRSALSYDETRAHEGAVPEALRNDRRAGFVFALGGKRPDGLQDLDRGGEGCDPDDAGTIAIMRSRQRAADKGVGEQRDRYRGG
jgi:hypothetical protein